MGAIIIHRGKIVGIGYNQVRSDGSIFDGIHAEEKALGNTRARLRHGATLIVLRLRKSGRQGLAKPCEYCENLSRKSGIRNIWYSTDTGWERMAL